MILKEPFGAHFDCAPHTDQGATAIPTLSEVLADFPSLPQEALFLGIADDALPILLNLHDPVPGPLLVAADEGGGKTAFLQLVARGIAELHEPGDTQFGVITATPEEWKGFDEFPHCAGIFSTHHKFASDFTLSLAEWAHANKSNQSVVLLLDGLENIKRLSRDAQDSLRWLLLRGPARHVWPILSVNSQKAFEVNTVPILDLFRTRIYGRIKDPSHAKALTMANVDFSTLIRGSQFAIREGSQHIRFWIPHLDEN